MVWHGNDVAGGHRRERFKRSVKTGGEKGTETEKYEKVQRIRTENPKMERTRDPRITTNFPHRTLLQVRPRRTNRKPVNYQLYQEKEALLSTKLWTTEWIPEDDRFLMAYCQSGRLSNRVLCILNALNFAAVLNRTLLITMDQNVILYHYDRHLIFDIAFFRSCYGSRVVMTVEEYRQIYGDDVIVDQVVCLCGKPCRQDFSNPNATFLNQGHVVFLKSALNFKIPRAYVRSVTVEELKMEIGDSPGRILFMGEFFYNNLKNKNTLFLSVKRSEDCRSNAAVLPHHSILEFGKLFVKDVFQGQKFMAVHLRREDFALYCNRGLGCFLPIEEIVQCLKEKVELSGVKVVYLATNTNHKEIRYIKRNLTNRNNERIQVVQLKTELMKENKMVLPIPDEDEGARSLWEAQLDKVICLHSQIFVGSARSTFTVDIQRMRYAFRHATPKDTYLCEEPH